MIEKVKMLVITMDNQLSEQINNCVKQKSISVYNASTIEEVNNYLNIQHIEVVMIDEKISFIDVLDFIKTNKKMRPDIEFIIVSESFDQKNILKFMKAGVSNYLKKPVDNDELSEAFDITIENINLFSQLQLKILIVDDTRIAIKATTNMLNKIGYYNILTAKDGQDAITVLQNNSQIGLIISDLNMPNKNGYELLEWIRSNSVFRKTPFIMATSQAEQKYIVKAASAGANHFLIKPFGLDDVKNALEESIKISRFSYENDIKPKDAPKHTDGKVNLNIGYIPITDHLILGVLKHWIENGECEPKYFNLHTRKLFHWHTLQKLVAKGTLDAGFMLAPLAMDLFSSYDGIKLLLLSHKNGSSFVKSTKSENHTENQSIEDFFKNKLFYLPHQLSVHHIISHMFFKGIGLNPGYVGQENVNLIFESIPAIMMPAYVTSYENVCGYMIAEPIATKGIYDGGVEKLFLSSELWRNHPCCILVMRDEIIEKNNDAIYELIDLLVQAGIFINEKPDECIDIALNFFDPDKLLGLNSKIFEDVLKDPLGVKTEDLYPDIADFDKIQRYMVDNIGIGNIIDLEKFIDTRFVDEAYNKHQLVRRFSRINKLTSLIENINKELLG